LDRVVSRIRLKDRSRLTWRDVERALSVAKRDFDWGDDQSTYVWSTLALAVLQISQSDVRSIRSRIRRAIVERSGHADKLEAYAHEMRGTAATQIHRFQLARRELEWAREVYHRTGDQRSEVRVRSRLAHIELLEENWAEAELIAENALRQISGLDGALDDVGGCLIVIGHAQFGMRRMDAALGTVEQILSDPQAGEVSRGKAYLLKAMLKLDSGKLNEAASDCQEAKRLFGAAGNIRGLQEAADLQATIAKG
jgi:tetratricopeptide (TPR) repeat protein